MAPFSASSPHIRVKRKTHVDLRSEPTESSSQSSDNHNRLGNIFGDASLTNLPPSKESQKSSRDIKPLPYRRRHDLKTHLETPNFLSNVLPLQADFFRKHLDIPVRPVDNGAVDNPASEQQEILKLVDSAQTSDALVTKQDQVVHSSEVLDIVTETSPQGACKTVVCTQDSIDIVAYQQELAQSISSKRNPDNCLALRQSEPSLAVDASRPLIGGASADISLLQRQKYCRVVESTPDLSTSSPHQEQAHSQTPDSTKLFTSKSSSKQKMAGASDSMDELDWPSPSRVLEDGEFPPLVSTTLQDYMRPKQNTRNRGSKQWKPLKITPPRPIVFRNEDSARDDSSVGTNPRAPIYEFFQSSGPTRKSSTSGMFDSTPMGSSTQFFQSSGVTRNSSANGLFDNASPEPSSQFFQPQSARLNPNLYVPTMTPIERLFQLPSNPAKAKGIFRFAEHSNGDLAIIRWLSKSQWTYFNRIPVTQAPMFWSYITAMSRNKACQKIDGELDQTKFQLFVIELATKLRGGNPPDLELRLSRSNGALTPLSQRAHDYLVSENQPIAGQVVPSVNNQWFEKDAPTIPPAQPQIHQPFFAPRADIAPYVDHFADSRFFAPRPMQAGQDDPFVIPNDQAAGRFQPWHEQISSAQRQAWQEQEAKRIQTTLRRAEAPYIRDLARHAEARQSPPILAAPPTSRLPQSYLASHGSASIRQEMHRTVLNDPLRSKPSDLKLDVPRHQDGTLPMLHPKFLSDVEDAQPRTFDENAQQISRWVSQADFETTPPPISPLGMRRLRESNSIPRSGDFHAPDSWVDIVRSSVEQVIPPPDFYGPYDSTYLQDDPPRAAAGFCSDVDHVSGTTSGTYVAKVNAFWESGSDRWTEQQVSAKAIIETALSGNLSVCVESSKWLVPLHDRLNDYVKRSASKYSRSEDCFNKFSVPPDWAIDRSAKALGRVESLFRDKDLEKAPQRIGRDPRFASMRFPGTGPLMTAPRMPRFGDRSPLL